MGSKLGLQATTSESLESSVTQRLGAFVHEAREFLRKIPRGIPEPIKEELMCTRQLKDVVEVLGEKGSLLYQQDDMLWVEVESPRRSDEFIILRMEGPLRKVIGQYVRPQNSNGQYETLLTDMDPRQTKEIIGGLHDYAYASTKLGDGETPKQETNTSGIGIDSTFEQGENYPPLTCQEVIEEAERILQRAYADNLQSQARINEGGYRKVPDLEDFVIEPQVTLHANFGHLI